MVSIPFSKNKHYLTGIDWLLHGFDYMNKKASGVGNGFQIVMELEGVPAEGEVRDALDAFLAKLPVLGGSARRDYNLAPYWKLPPSAQRARSALRVHHVRDESDAFRVLEAEANAPFESERQHVSFCLVTTGENSRAAAKFDHRLFDAHGAEAFLRMFERDFEAGGECTWDPVPLEPAHLNHWWEKFEAGKQVNRALLRLVEDAPPRALPLAPSLKGRDFRFRVISFSEPQTREIIDRAESRAGYLMAMPYTMALAAQSLHTLFAKKGTEANDYIVPVTMDIRTPGSDPDAVFFNHVSLLLFRIRDREVDDLSALVDSLKQQMYDQTKTGLARHILDASLLMRILPLPLVGRMLRIYLKEKIASFCFSFLGDTGHLPMHFAGKEVRHSYHMTRVPIPPGLGLFFHHSRGRLSACLSYLQGQLTEDEADAVLEGLKARLAG